MSSCSPRTPGPIRRPTTPGRASWPPTSAPLGTRPTAARALTLPLPHSAQGSSRRGGWPPPLNLAHSRRDAQNLARPGSDPVEQCRIVSQGLPVGRDHPPEGGLPFRRPCPVGEAASDQLHHRG